MEEAYETIDLRELFFIIKNGLVFIITVTLVATLLGGLVTAFVLTPQYEANATMIVNTRQDQSMTVTNDQLTSAKNLVSTYSIIVKSDTVLNRVIEKLQLDTNYETLKEQVTVSAVDATQVMQVAVRDPDPARAKSVVAEITAVAPEIIQEMVEAGSVKVISEARVGQKPVSPNTVMNLVISALVGAVVSVGIVLLREMLNNTFKTDDDIQKHLSMVVIGVIPEIEVS